jgi:hypothetical protein
MLGAHGAHADEPNSKRKRRRSSVEVIDLSEGTSPSKIYPCSLPFLNQGWQFFLKKILHFLFQLSFYSRCTCSFFATPPSSTSLSTQTKPA